jgi:hypothetical protein
MSFNRLSLKIAAILGCILLCVSCTSNDDGGGGDGGTASTTVSGTATAPNGSLAKLSQPGRKAWYARLFSLSETWAQTIVGFTPVPNATVLVFRINPTTGVPVGPVLVQTTTNGAGGYSLILPAGVTPSSDVILQITNAAAPQPVGTAGTMSTPLVQTALNVDPISEGVVQAVLAYIDANPPATLANFSNNELIDLIAMIRAVVAANPNLVGGTIGQTIANIQGSLAPQINNAIPQMASGTRYLIIFSTALPNGQVGVPYSQPILAIGAPGPLTYQVTAGTLPAGVSLNAGTGQLTGTPTTQGTSNFTVQVSVATPPPSPVTQALALTIDPPPPPPPSGLERVSVLTGGGQANGASSAFTGFDRVSISRDGTAVAFSSEATNLVANDTNGQPDVFMLDRQGTGTTTRVSVSSTGAQGTGDSIRPMVSGNGRYVVFSSKSNLDPLDTSVTTVYDIYRHDRTTGETRLINTFGAGQQFGGYANPPFPATNDAGNLVLWSDGIFEIFVFDLAPGAPIPFGAVVPTDINPPPANPFLLNPVTSDDGRFVAFVTNRAYVAADTNGFADIYLADRGAPVGGTPVFTRLTNASSSTAVSFAVSMSADGNLIAFSSRDPEAAGDTNGLDDVYVYNRTTGTKTRVSLGSGGAEANGASTAPALSADGRFVAFESTATNLVAADTNNRADIYQFDRNTGVTRRVSINTNPALGGGLRPWPTGNGGLTAFASTATDLVSNDTNGVSDVFVGP